MLTDGMLVREMRTQGRPRGANEGCLGYHQDREEWPVGAGEVSETIMPLEISIHINRSRCLSVVVPLTSQRAKTRIVIFMGLENYRGNLLHNNRCT